MSETNPVPITHAGHTPTALEIIHDYILSISPGVESNVGLFMAYRKDAPGIVRWLEEVPGNTIDTMGTLVGAELPIIRVSVRGNPGDLQGPKDEMIRLRYALLAARNYTSRGITLYSVIEAPGAKGVKPLGRDLSDREGFGASFEAMVSPSYE